MFWKGKSFVIKMVNNNEIDETETTAIDVDELISKAIAAGVILIGAYMGMSTVRQLIIGHPEPATIINTVAPIFNNDNSSAAVLGGHLHKIVRNNDTGEVWESVTEAAKAAGVTLPLMSKHLNGHTDRVLGQTYSIIGVGN